MPVILPADTAIFASQRLAKLKALLLSQALVPADATKATVTIAAANAVSTINGNAATAPSIANSDARLTYAHTLMATDPSHPAFYKGSHLSFSDGSKGAGGPVGIRFATDAPAFELATLGTNGRVSVKVDGVYISRGLAVSTPNDSASRYILVDFGNGSADAATYVAAGIALQAPGSGHAAGDVVTYANGVKGLVGSVSGGAITNLTLYAKGSAASSPAANPIAQTATTGAGTGSSANITWGLSHSVRKMRHVEILAEGFEFRGLNVDSFSTVRPWPVSLGPCVFYVGDSYFSGAFNDYPGSQISALSAELLGVDNWWPFAQGGTGYVKTNGTAQNYVSRASDVIAQVPSDASVPLLIVSAGGINDTGVASSAQLQAAVTNYHDLLMSALPNAYFLTLGPWRGPLANPSQSYSDACKNGFLASQAIYDPQAKRSAFADIYAEAWQTIGGNSNSPTGAGNTDFYDTSDSKHFHQDGWNYLGWLLANKINEFIQSLPAR
jgi:hypothetical protein